MEYVEFTSLTIGIISKISFYFEINVTEEILSRTSLEDFEASRFQKTGRDRFLTRLIVADLITFNVFSELTWENVLRRVTKHFSDEFSQFCDRKMSDFVWMLCWNKVRPEPLLQGFVGASKSVCLVHLLANSVSLDLKSFVWRKITDLIWFTWKQLVVTSLRIWFELWFNLEFMCTVVWLSAR
ncbi:hypothetical protein Bca4012_025968 [Brassica carinata]